MPSHLLGEEPNLSTPATYHSTAPKVLFLRLPLPYSKAYGICPKVSALNSLSPYSIWGSSRGPLLSGSLLQNWLGGGTPSPSFPPHQAPGDSRDEAQQSPTRGQDHCGDQRWYSHHTGLATEHTRQGRRRWSLHSHSITPDLVSKGTQHFEPQ